MEGSIYPTPEEGAAVETEKKVDLKRTTNNGQPPALSSSLSPQIKHIIPDIKPERFISVIYRAAVTSHLCFDVIIQSHIEAQTCIETMPLIRNLSKHEPVTTSETQG